MAGLWFGVNLLLPFLAIYWFINPDFLFYKKSLKRRQIALIISIIIFIDTVLLVLMATSSKQVNDYDIVGFVIGIIVLFCIGAWRFYRYGQYSILSKLPIQTIPIAEPKPSIIIDNQPTIDNANTKNDSNLLKDKTENTPQIIAPIEMAETTLPIQNTPNHSNDNSNTTISQTEKDWQAYKQKMEQSWQETRKTLTEKMNNKP